MTKTVIIVLLLFSFFPQAQALSKECRLEASLPDQSPRSLSNNQVIMVPTLARDFEALMVFGKMDNEAIETILRKNNLYPLQFKWMNKTYSLGALSFFNYRESDMGSFREIYLVVMASKIKMNAFQSLKAFFKAIRASQSVQDTDIVLFHLKAYSSSPMAVLGSRELWKIDSDLATIQSQHSGGSLQFDFKSQGKSMISSFDLNAFVKIPKKIHLNLDASGPVFEGEQAYSHIISCSEAAFAIFNPKHHRIAVDHEMKRLLDGFSFRPWFVEYSPHSQAIQFAPR